MNVIGRARGFLFPLLVGVSSCAIQRAEIASRAKKELVGMSKKDQLACAGVPSRQDRREDLEFLTFTGTRDTVGTGAANSSAPDIMFGVYRAPQRDCEAAFILKDGIVQEVSYKGRTEGERCAFIVENCLLSERSQKCQEQGLTRRSLRE